MHYADETLLLTIHVAGPNKIIHVAVRTISELGTSATSRVSERAEVGDGARGCALFLYRVRTPSWTKFFSVRSRRSSTLSPSFWAVVYTPSRRHQLNPSAQTNRMPSLANCLGDQNPYRPADPHHGQ